jgi:hypothetical protein
LELLWFYRMQYWEGYPYKYTTFFVSKVSDRIEWIHSVINGSILAETAMVPEASLRLQFMRPENGIIPVP